MNAFVVSGISFLALIGLLIIGVPVGFSAAAIGIIGLLLMSGPDVLFVYLGSIPYSEVAYYGFTIIPLFVILGEFSYYGGFAEGLYLTIRNWIGKFHGGLAMATIIGGAGFGAASGASTASSAVLGKICIPEMRKYGYAPSLAAGTVASCANLSSMIPPSGLMIIYAILTEQSVGKLFIGGVMPGILITVLFCTMVNVQCRINPNIGPPMTESISWKTRFTSIRYSWGIVIIALIVIVGIYFGFFTPTEAGAAGASAALCMGLVTKKLSIQNLKQALLSGAKTTSMLFIMFIGVNVFTRFLAVSRMPLLLGEWLTGLTVPPYVIIICILLLYLMLGMFFDGISMLILTIPIIFPSVIALGYDPIWFGVICVLMCEVGLITPPVGMNCYVVASTTPDIPLEQIFRGIAPFVIIDLLVAAILIAFPEVVLFLPGQI